VQRLRKTANFFSFLIASIAAILVLVFIFSQTEWSRRIIVNELVKTVEQTTNGTVTIGKLEGNLITGFVLSDVNLKLKTGTKYDSTTLLHADRAIVRYSLIRFLRRNELGATSIVLLHPTFNIVKFAGDTLWNYSMLTKPVAKNQPPPKPFDQIVDLQSVRIQGGIIRVRDYNFPEQPIKTVGGAEIKERQFDWADIRIVDLDLDGRFYAKGSTAQSLRVNHLRFNDQSSGFFVHHLELSAYLDGIQCRLDNAHIITGHSDVRFSVDVAPPTILHDGLLESLKHSNTQLMLSGPSISTYELRQFVPALGFLNGTPGIDLDVAGEFGKLRVNKLDLDFKGRGSIDISGYLYNLHQPEDLSMDLTVAARGLSNATLRSYVPGLGIPDLSRLGIVNIPNLRYTGEPLNFKTVLDVRTTGAGNVKGNATLDLRGREMVYKADLTTDHVNLAGVIKDEAWQSDLNANIRAEGKGTDWRTLRTKVSIASTGSSNVGKYGVTYISGSFAMNNGVITTDGLNFQMPGGPTADINSATINLRSPLFTYQFNGSVKEFMPSKFIPTFPVKGMMIDLVGNINGSGKNFENIYGTLDTRIYNLTLNGKPLKEVKASLAIGPKGSNNSLVLNSDIADIDMEGRFTVNHLINTIPQRIDAITEAISKKYFPDLTQPSAVSALSGPCGDSLDFGFGIHVKDLRPLAAFVPQSLLLVEGKIEGSVFGCSAREINLLATSDTFAFLTRDRTVPTDSVIVVTDTVTGDTSHRIVATTRGTRVQLTKSKFSLVLNNLVADPHKVLEVMNAHFEYKSDSVVRFNTALLYQPQINLDYRDQRLAFDVGGVYNANTGLRAKGNAAFPSGDLAVTLDTLRFALNQNRARPYAWQNETPAHILVTPDGLISIDTLSLMQPALGDQYNLFAQRIKLGGQIKGDTILGVWLKVPMMRISEIDSLLPPSAKSFTTKLGQFAGIIQAFDVTMHGTLARPEFDSYLRINNLKYSGLSFDSAVADIHYKNFTVSGRVGMHVDSASLNMEGTEVNLSNLSAINALQVNIESIPVLISFKRGPTYAQDSARVYNQPVSASLTANQFPLDVVGPFIPVFTNLRGIGNIDIAVRGTLRNIDYSGNAKIQNGMFLLAANNLYYTFDGDLSLNNEKLQFNNVTVRNISADDPNGSATLTGSLTFKGFTISRFDLVARSNEITVLTDNSRSVMRSFYGPLRISTTGEDLTFSGPFEAPLLEGNITILQAFLKLPQGSGGQQVTNSKVIYRTIGDFDTTAELANDTTAAGRLRKLRAAASLTNISTPELDGPDYSLENENIYLEEPGLSSEDRLAQTVIDSLQSGKTGASSSKFMDRMQFRVQVNMQRDVWVTISFSGLLGLLGQQLIADLRSDGPIYIYRGDDHQFHVNGTLRLTENSSYTMIKRFSPATGIIHFADDPTNPEFAITAEYTGTHTTSGGDEEEVTIRLGLNGTMEEPHINIEVLRKDAFGNLAAISGTEADQLENATYFLLSGQLKSDLNDPNIASVIAKGAGKTITNQFANSLLERAFGSSAVGNVLRQFSFEYAGARSRVQLTAGYRDIVFKYGGYVNSLGQADYSVEIPFSTFSNFKYSRNFIWEIDVHSGDQNSPDQIIQQPNLLNKWLWRIPLH